MAITNAVSRDLGTGTVTFTGNIVMTTQRRVSRSSCRYSPRSAMRRPRTFAITPPRSGNIQGR